MMIRRARDIELPFPAQDFPAPSDLLRNRQGQSWSWLLRLALVGFRHRPDPHFVLSF
jgi:hypothetical protein